MLEYDVVWDSRLPDLIKEINRLIAEGWKPLGGMAPDKAAFYQTMTREVKKPKRRGVAVL